MAAESTQSDRRSQQLEQALLALDRVGAGEILSAAQGQLASLQLVEAVVVPALERIGQGWERGDVSLAQVYMSGRICEDLVDAILPPASPERVDRPRMAIAVLEDYHLLGKRIIYSALRASGFELLNYDRMGVEELVERVSQDGVKILLVSVLMLPSALRVKDLRAALEQAGCQVRIVVGGAPFRFDEQLWREVGADAMGATAAEAIEIVRRFVDGP